MNPLDEDPLDAQFRQAVEQRLAELVAQTERSRFLLLRALADLHRAPVGARTLSQAKVQGGKGGDFVGDQSIQLHGGAWHGGPMRHWPL